MCPLSWGVGEPVIRILAPRESGQLRTVGRRKAVWGWRRRLEERAGEGLALPSGRKNDVGRDGSGMCLGHPEILPI